MLSFSYADAHDYRAHSAAEDEAGDRTRITKTPPSGKPPRNSNR